MDINERQIMYHRQVAFKHKQWTRFLFFCYTKLVLHTYIFNGCVTLKLYDNGLDKPPITYGNHTSTLCVNISGDHS